MRRCQYALLARESCVPDYYLNEFHTMLLWSRSGHYDPSAADPFAHGAQAGVSIAGQQIGKSIVR